LIVRTIFKWLIGTVVAIVVSALTIEGINVVTVGNQINQLSKLAVKQACVLFSQETYKRNDALNVNTHDIFGASGTLAVSGIFYSDSAPEQIYKNLYTSNDDFKNWAMSYTNIWNNLEIMKMGMGLPSSAGLTADNYMLADSYREEMMTPLNLGITYLDKETVQRITQWNLAAIFSNGQQANVVDNDGPRIYVKYKGFKIYVNDAKITNIQYKVLNVINDKNEFEQLSHIDSTSLGIDSATDERANVCVAGIEYSVPMSYEGVTPLKRIVEYAWNTRVQGLNNSAAAQPNQTYSESETSLVGGGFTGNNALPVPGTLIFYVMK
jgi:hypothetical protein